MPTPAPWLAGVVASSGALEATALRRALAQRGCRVRAIPGVGAREAWNGVLADGRTVAVVQSRPGPAGAAEAARHWVLQTETLAVLESGVATADGSERLLAEGDDALVARARAVAPALRPGRIASTAIAPRSAEARASLAAAGIDAIDGGSEEWRIAAARVAVPALALARLGGVSLPPSARGDLVVRWLRLAAHPRRRDPLSPAERAAVEQLLPAARAALAACLGPAPA